MTTPTETEQILAAEVTDALQAEKELMQLENQLAENPEFAAFLQKQKAIKENIDAFWKGIEEQMIKNDIKSLKGEWGSLTIAERIGWEISPLLTLAPKFYKKVVDLKKLTDTFRLEGKPIKGATPKYTKYLTKRIK